MIRGFLMEKRMPKLRILRVRAAMAFGRLLGVPMQVHQVFFAKGISSKMS